MSSPSTTVTDVLPRDASNISVLTKPLKAIGFWAAVALPFLYVPLLATGITERASQVAALVLIALHVAALVVGRHHYTDE